MNLFKSNTPTKLLALAALSSSAFGGEITSEAVIQAPVQSDASSESLYDKIWGLATLYKDKDNPFIQEIKLRGRYHGQWHQVESDQGDENDWEDRRSRFGFDVKLLKNFELRIDAQSTDEFDPFYNGLVDAYIKWKAAPEFNLTIGKQKPQTAYYDWLSSTNATPTFERSQIFNQLRVDRLTGAAIDGKIGNFTYQTGIFSSDVDLEFGQFEAGVVWTAGIGYDLSSALGVKKADWRLDYLHSDDNPNATFFNRYDDLLTTTFVLQEGRFGLASELFYAANGDVGWGDAFGLLIQPTYDIIEKKLQLVGRYTFSTAEGEDGIQAQSRYERRAPFLTDSGRGNSYHSFYGGLQYFIYGDKLKLLAGAEYAKLDGGADGGDYEGWTFLTGVRFSF